MTSPVRVRAHAKVNLHLRVVARRPDGYHDLETILHGVGVADEIEAEATTSTTVEVEMERVDGLRGELPGADENLVRRATDRLHERAAREHGVAIRVVKRIPLGAGLGGGSSDAAGALVALNELWNLGLSRENLIAEATGLGSDVPYFIHGGTALASGRGEVLVPLRRPPGMWFVLGVSESPLATRDVYRHWDELGLESDAVVEPMVRALERGGSPRRIAALLHNDLERVAFDLRPGLAASKQSLLRAGALGACLAGSCATLFAIASDERHARSIAASTEDEFDRVLIAVSAAHCIERLR